MSSSETLTAQLQVEEATTQIFQSHTASTPNTKEESFVLYRDRHVKYLLQGLSRPLPEGFISLGASRTWIVYWIVHSLALLDELSSLSTEVTNSIIDFLSSCQHENGGFGGGPGQLAHIATTYASVSALVTIGSDDALSIIQRDRLMDFFLTMSIPKDDGGGMRMHAGGEIDVRGCYCALSVCYMLNMDVSHVAEACGLGRFVQQCQSHEGGFGGEPGNESHGGYAFCAYAAIEIAGMRHSIDRTLLTSWLSRMQGKIEGGMRGRTNKLVDGCYSFWQGGLCRIIHENDDSTIKGDQTVDKLPEVDLLACENLIDSSLDTWVTTDRAPAAKMDSEKLHQLQVDLDKIMDDFLIAEERCKDHSSEYNKKQVTELGSRAVQMQEDIQALEQNILAYDVISKLSLMIGQDQDPHCSISICDMSALQRWILLACQIEGRGGLRDKPGMHADFYHTCYCLSGLSAAQWSSGWVLGGEKNRLVETHTLCNVVVDKVKNSRRFFQ